MILLFVLWMLPQNIIGLVVWAITRAVYSKKSKVFFTNRDVGISLGWFVIVSKWASDRTINHELGHLKQSKMLGPLYLFVVGIPSFIRATVWYMCKKKHSDYYKGYPEKWADRLGGVTRG